MDTTRAKALLPLIKALADGETIQFEYDDNDWIDLESPVFNGQIKNYRVKPKQHRVYVNIHSNGATYPYSSKQGAVDGFSSSEATEIAVPFVREDLCLKDT